MKMSQLSKFFDCFFSDIFFDSFHFSRILNILWYKITLSVFGFFSLFYFDFLEHLLVHDLFLLPEFFELDVAISSHLHDVLVLLVADRSRLDERRLCLLKLFQQHQSLEIFKLTLIKMIFPKDLSSKV